MEDRATRMRREWEERAAKDAFHYTASWEEGWDEEAYLGSGEETYQQFVRPVFEQIGFTPGDKVMLELGCGAGRMTGSFASRFRAVYALDISRQMLRRARELHPLENVIWLATDGTDLSLFRSDSFDFVFTYTVLQHLPAQDLALAYITEMLRTLKPEGIFIIQFNSDLRFEPTLNWKGKLVWRAIERLDRGVLGERGEHLARHLASRLGIDPLVATETWRGAPLPPRIVLQTIWATGGAVLGVGGWDTKTTLCWGTARRPAREIGARA